VPSPKRGGRLQLGKPVEETVRAPRSAFIHTDSEGRPLTGADDDPGVIANPIPGAACGNRSKESVPSPSDTASAGVGKQKHVEGPELGDEQATP